MTSLMKKLVDTYNHVNHDLADPRTNNYFLISSPIPIITITGIYLYFCTSYGKRYMKDRKPYSLRNIFFVYNIFQVLMNTYLFSKGVQYMWSDQYSFACETVDYSDKPRAIMIANTTWWYFFSKVIDYLDTIFFVLRKKNNQLSFLHIYHHSVMALFMWVGVKYFPGGHGVVMGTLNAFVHIVMYTYYFIAGMGPEYQKYIWWKKHLTVLQLVQFVIILVHNTMPLFTDCSYPKSLNMGMILNSLLFIHLFGKFFIANYIKTKPKTIQNGLDNGNGTVKKETSNGHGRFERNFKNGVEIGTSNGKHKAI